MEKIIVQDKRLMDLGILSNLLGKDAVNRLHLTYLGRETIIKGNLSFNPNMPVVIINAYDSDLDILDDYLDCPFSIKRALMAIDDNIYWVYLKK